MGLIRCNAGTAGAKSFKLRSKVDYHSQTEVAPYSWEGHASLFAVLTKFADRWR